MSKSHQVAVETYDVVVLGYGGAGAAAAISAHDAGASTLIVEAGAASGGNTRASGGSLRPIDDVEGALHYLNHLCGSETPREVLEALVVNTGPTLTWLEDLGAELVKLDSSSISAYPRITDVTYPDVPGAAAMAARLRVEGRPGELGGPALWGVLSRAVSDRGIATLMETRARRLRRSENGMVEVTLEGADGEVVVSASAVVLATGGFAHAQDLVEDFTGHPLASFGPPENRGDGLLMAQDMGADLWHTPAFAATLGYVLDGMPVPVRHQSPTAGFVYVDLSGKRFVDETGTDFHALPMSFLRSDARTGRYSRMPSYFVFDENTRLAGPIANTALTYGEVEWSPDNSAEIARGLITAAATISELAALVGLNPDALVATIGAYNASCASGRDEVWGRRDLEPISRSPFYAIPVSPVLVNTQGGPRRDASARILDPGGTPVPSLFGAGELGSIWGQHYPGAGNLTEALVFGRIAGHGAAAAAKGATR